MAEPQPPTSGIQVKANDDALRGRYASHMQVMHTREEFILDFMMMVPPLAQLQSRIIVSPAHCKRILGALSDNVAKYEKLFGKIVAGVGATEQDKEIGFKVG